jgi:hypothetical protein
MATKVQCPDGYAFWEEPFNDIAITAGMLSQTMGDYQARSLIVRLITPVEDLQSVLAGKVSRPFR